MIKKEDNLKEVVDNFPELGQVLSKYGLHCVGCHASANESINDGCLAHGLSEKDIIGLINECNKKIKEVDLLDDVKFSKKAVEKLEKMLKEKNCSYIKIIPIFGGFDFEATNEKNGDDVLEEFPILLNKKIRRFLKGVTIDFVDKENDFVAKRD